MEIQHCNIKDNGAYPQISIAYRNTNEQDEFKSLRSNLWPMSNVVSADNIAATVKA